MQRCRWAVTLSIIPIVVLSFAVPSFAEEVHFSIGLKQQYVKLDRTLKQAGVGRVHTPGTDPAWRPGVVFNAVYDRLFFGASYSKVYLVDFSTSDLLFFKKNVDLEVSQLDLAVGYTIMTGVSPYLGYLRHEQRTDAKCGGCIGTVEMRRAGPGLMINLPLPSPQWTVYANAALIQGFSLQGGVSYAGIRWPVVVVVGYSYQRIDYPSGEFSCDLPGCFRDRDVFTGPTVMADYTF